MPIDYRFMDASSTLYAGHGEAVNCPLVMKSINCVRAT